MPSIWLKRFSYCVNGATCNNPISPVIELEMYLIPPKNLLDGATIMLLKK